MRWLPDRIRSCLAIVIEDTPNLLSGTANRRWCFPLAVRGSHSFGWPQVGWAPGPETGCPTVAAPDAPRCAACVRSPGTRASHSGTAETLQWRRPVRWRAGHSRPLRSRGRVPPAPVAPGDAGELSRAPRAAAGPLGIHRGRGRVLGRVRQPARTRALSRRRQPRALLRAAAAPAIVVETQREAQS